MKSINRRELNQRSGQILNEVLDSGEPVRVVGRDGRAIVIAPDTSASESVYEQWARAGMIGHRTRTLAEPPNLSTSSSMGDILDDIRADR